MAHIQRRRGKKGVTYRVRYIDPDGRERSRSFDRKADAENFATDVSHQMLAGSYVDPRAGTQTVQEYLEAWRKQQAHHRRNTAEQYRIRFKTMVYPYLGHTPIGKLRPSQIRNWQAQLLIDQTDDRTGKTRPAYAPSTVKGARDMVASAFGDAVLDRLISHNPFGGVKAPEVPKAKIVPLTIDQVRAGEAACVEHLRAVITTVAGTGLRAGEVLGMTVDRIDFLRKRIRVDRQLLGRRGPEPIFGPPKSTAGDRTVPIPDRVVAALAAHIAKYPPGPHGLIFTNRRGTPVSREQWFEAWNDGPRQAMGLGAREGLHQLRHFYASLLIAAGRNVKEVQERLGHASPSETLETYTHLWHDSDDGTRDAIDAAFNANSNGAAPKGNAVSE